VDEPELTVPAERAAVPAPPAGSVVVPVQPLPRWFAIVQAIAVSGVPTGLFVALVLILTTDMPPFEGAGLSLEFLATVTLLDTALIALLIRVFLELSGEDSRGVFLGRRPVLGEMLRGIALVPVMFGAVTAVVLGLRAVAPWLHTVKVSPLEQFMKSPLDASIFLIVVVLGGGVREELQRAFILHRFKQCLGGYRVGLVVFSVVFGLLHWDQGGDVAIAIGLLGLFWGVLYVKRGSAVMGMTNHAGFNALQVAQGVLARTLGV
jgi:membrane protease YdiL (CAAX protease family)